MEFFYKLIRENDNYTITKKKSKLNTKFIDKKIVDKYINTQLKIKELNDNDIKYIESNLLKIFVKKKYYIWELLNFDINNCYTISSDDINSESNIYKVNSENQTLLTYIGKVKDTKEKYQNVLFNTLSPKIWSIVVNLNRCARENYLYKYKLKLISQLFDVLKINGDFYFVYEGFCNEQVINLYYLLSFMFKSVIIYSGSKILCKHFNPIIKKSDIIIDDNFNIEPKFKLNEFIKYQEKMLLHKIKKNKLLIDKKESEFINLYVNEIITSFKYYNINVVNEIMADFNLSLIDLFKSTYINNKVVKTSSAINGKEGHFLINIINKYNLVNILEIGFAFGISAFYILSNPKTKLTSIDPFQKSQWHNKGLELLKEYKFDSRHKLYELKSYVALPQLLEKYNTSYYDFIFIDGFHTFDYTLLDFFYANLLLKMNGIIIIDDAMHSGVSKCVKYIETNYADFYKKLESPLSFAMFQKIDEDKRDWNYHKPF
jgi:predicted O-methyltransferase YrrM